jgi:putative DNA methylase
MPMTEPRKKLIEVALPLDAINNASAYDKMPGIGPHPKGIHQWWARLPLPTARAILFASLVNDPSSDPGFEDKPEDVQTRERERLFGIMHSLLQKKINENPKVLQEALAEIERSCDGKLPSILDPFAGGGSIPLEAMRLGLRAYASDLNPVAVMINKACLEFIPKFGQSAPVNPDARNNKLWEGHWQKAQGLASDVRYYAKWVLDEAKKRIGHLYPPAPNGGQVVAWLWARDVVSPNPACNGARVPLATTFWLSKRRKKEVYLEPAIDRAHNTYSFQVKVGKPADLTRTNSGTKAGKGSNFRCILSGEPIGRDYIRQEALANRMSGRQTAVVVDTKGGRLYLPAEDSYPESPANNLPQVSAPLENLSDDRRAITPPDYGMKTIASLFSPRQLVAITTLSDLVREAHHIVLLHARDANLFRDETTITSYADAVVTLLAFALDRCADFNNSLCRWSPSNEKVMNLFSIQVIPIVWDYAEANILGDQVGSWITCSDYVASCIEVVLVSQNAGPLGQVFQMDAASALPDTTDGLLISTDPPYYDNVGYADISDFFYVWMRRTVGFIYPEIFSTLLTPKKPELAAVSYRFDNSKENAKSHFEAGFKKAFNLLRGRLDPRFPLTVYYAFKQDDQVELDATSPQEGTLTTGWETLLAALILTGFQITATWPVRASQEWRARSMGANALASYIVLASRPRPDTASLATRREFIGALKKELPAALKALTHGGIAPVDLAQASIGPGMSVFSRYAKVLEADGTPMSVRTALQIINQALDEYLTSEEGDLDRETRFALAWFQQFGNGDGPFGEADVLARAKDTAVEAMARAGMLHSRAGKVRLLRRGELEEDWDPRVDARLTVWESTQQLIRRLNEMGEVGAARLLKQLGGGRGEDARALAYRLYAICERKKWADEALAYNALVVSWPEIERKAAGMEGEVEQGRLL